MSRFFVSHILSLLVECRPLTFCVSVCVCVHSHAIGHGLGRLQFTGWIGTCGGGFVLFVVIVVVRAPQRPAPPTIIDL